MPGLLTIAIRAAQVEAQALRAAAEALSRGEGPDAAANVDDAVGAWLIRRAESIEACI